MFVRSIGANKLSFSATGQNYLNYEPFSFVNSESPPDLPAPNLAIRKTTSKSRSLTSKKWGLGLSSFFVPGAGQMVNSQISKGLPLFISGTILKLFIFNRNVPESSVSTVSLVVHALLSAFSVVDALKYAKDDSE